VVNANEDKEQKLLDQVGEQFISVSEASRISKLTPSYIRRLLRRQEIAGVKFGRDWFTTEEAIRGYLAEDRRPGPKTK
jgi:excisionase family DNA binding protein